MQVSLFRFVSATALAFGAAAFSTAALAAPDLETNAYTEAWFADSSSVVDANSNDDSYWSNIGAGTDYGSASALSRADGVLGASASAGSSGVAAARAAFVVVGPGDDLDTPPVSVQSLSSAIWEDTIVNTSGNTLDYTFLFRVYGAALQLSATSGNSANIGVRISVDGVTSYSSNATLSGATLSLGGDFLATGYSEWDNNYSFNPFDASLSIGSIAAGGEFTLRYELWAETQMWTDPDSSWGSGNNWTYASIGDPFGWENGPGMTVTTHAKDNGGGVPGIPEPATWALLIAGFGLVGMAARRRRALAV